MRASVLLVCALGCGSSNPAIYLHTSDDGSSRTEGTLTEVLRIKPDTCDGISEMHPEYTPLDEGALVRFLEGRGYQTRQTRARADLVFVDVVNAGGKRPVRLRVAILPSSFAAGRELHEAILDHGPGSWGVHRSNLAVLAPIGDTDEVVGFAIKTKLACWGVLTVAGLDDTFVVAGGYTEL